MRRASWDWPTSLQMTKDRENYRFLWRLPGGRPTVKIEMSPPPSKLWCTNLDWKRRIGFVYPSEKYVPTVWFESHFTWCFTRTISAPKYKRPRPFHRSDPNISTNNNNNNNKKLSAPGDSHRWQLVVISIGNAVPLKIIPSDVHGPITLNNWIQRMNKCHFKRDTRLCNRDNQDDFNDATWIWINPTILAIRW